MIQPIVRWLLVAVVALIGAGAPAMAGTESANGAGTATAVSGPVTVTRLAATPQPLNFGDALFWGDVVETRREGFARLWLAASITVTVQELSRLELRREARATGPLYAFELLRGKLRVSVARVLLPQGWYVEVRTRNAVASVRGTELSVETVERLAWARAFGFLGARAVEQGADKRGSHLVETVVIALSGRVDVRNRSSGTPWVDRIGAAQTSRVSGAQDPVRIRLRAEDLKAFSYGSTEP